MTRDDKEMLKHFEAAERALVQVKKSLARFAEGVAELQTLVEEEQRAKGKKRGSSRTRRKHP